MNFLLVLIALLLVIAIIFKIIVIIGALTRNKESVSGWVSRLYTPNYKPYKKMEKDKKDQLLEELFMQKLEIDLGKADGTKDEIYLADVVEDALVDIELAIEEEVSEQRFFIWPKERERLIKTWAKFIPNPANGGDDDFIVFDSFRGEYTFGENGFTPLCSSKELNGYYKDNNLEYIIKQPRY